MRNRVASQVRQSANICIFCALRQPRNIQKLRQNGRVSHRNFGSAAGTRAPAGAAAVQRDNDEDDLPSMLRQSAASSRPPPSDPFAARSARLPPARVLPQRSLPPRNGPQSGRQGDDGGFRIVRERVGRRDDQGSVPTSKYSAFNDGRPPRSQDASNKDGAQGRSARAGKYIAHWGPREKNSPQQSSNDPIRKNVGSRSLRLDADDSAIRANVDEDAKKNDEQSYTPRFMAPGSDESAYRSAAALPSSNSTRRAGRDPLINNKPTAQAASPAPAQREEADVSKAIASEEDEMPMIVRRVHKSTPSTYNKGIESHDTIQAVESTQNTGSTMSKFSGRFAVEEDQQDLRPPDRPTRPTRSTGGTRARGQAFDFDMYEAEQARRGEGRRQKKAKQPKVQDQKPALMVPEFLTVQQLAQAMKVKVDDLVKKLEQEGFEGARFDHVLDAETSAMFADMYGFDPVAAGEEMQDLVARPPPEDVSILPPRPPIVTIMGHVDHGKTTILDWLRKSSVAASEHGGITQHIGAFSVVMPGTERNITFLDTPGHEAFLDMRRRGANVTDIVVLVVAADDSVKPQTIEAIKHALEARVQLIVAINKIDKNDADIERVKQDLVQHDIVVESFGGDYQAIPVSGKTGQGMAELEEAIVTLADVLDLRAEQTGPAEGQIIESKVTNAGRVATVLVRRGVLHVGDFIVAGPTWGRVRTLRSDTGQVVQAAYPGDPVQVDGWRGSDPIAGLEVLQADNEQHAKDVIDLRHERAEVAQSASDISALNASRTQEAEARAKVLAWEAENQINTRRQRDNEGWVDAAASSGPKPVHFVVKADVAGSVEAIVAAISAIGNHEVQAKVIHSGTGPVTESDIQMLATTGEIAYAISFNQPVDNATYALAHAAGLQVLDHNIIYKLTDAVKEKVNEALPPTVTQRVLGEAEVGKIFEITVKKEKIKIAGAKVTNGTISKANRVRVVRNGEMIYTGTLESLKNVKKDVTEMRKGTECGIGFVGWNEVQEGDQVQCFEEKEEKRTIY